MIWRSLLYVPADNERFIARAHERGADAIILDLEDAVLPENKDRARDGLAEAIPRVGRSGATVFVRINSGLATAREDASAASAAGAAGLLVSKADPEKLTALDAHLNSEAGPLPFIALVEDPGTLLDARPIARCNRVIGLMAGGEDIATSLGAEASAETLRLPKLLVHYAARAEGVLSFGLLRSIADYGDVAAVEEAARDAYRHGFDGATCIHPSAVAALHRGFTPSEAEIAWASAVTDAARSANSGAFVVEGKMVDAPVIRRARRILRLAGVGTETAGR